MSKSSALLLNQLAEFLTRSLQKNSTQRREDAKDAKFFRAVQQIRVRWPETEVRADTWTPLYLDLTNGEIQRQRPALPSIHGNKPFSQQAMADLCNCQVNTLFSRHVLLLFTPNAENHRQFKAERRGTRSGALNCPSEFSLLGIS